MSKLYKRSIDELNEQQKKFKIILPEPIIIKKYPAQKLTFDEPNVIQFRKSYIDDNVNDFMQLPQRKLIIKNDNTISEYIDYLDKLIGIDHISLSNHKKPDAYYQFNMENKTDTDVRCDKLQTENNISNDFNVRERENEGENDIETIKESDDAPSPSFLQIPFTTIYKSLRNLIIDLSYRSIRACECMTVNN